MKKLAYEDRAGEIVFGYLKNRFAIDMSKSQVLDVKIFMNVRRKIKRVHF